MTDDLNAHYAPLLALGWTHEPGTPYAIRQAEDVTAKLAIVIDEDMPSATFSLVLTPTDKKKHPSVYGGLIAKGRLGAFFEALGGWTDRFSFRDRLKTAKSLAAVEGVKVKEQRRGGGVPILP